MVAFQFRTLCLEPDIIQIATDAVRKRPTEQVLSCSQFLVTLKQFLFHMINSDLMLMSKRFRWLLNHLQKLHLINKYLGLKEIMELLCHFNENTMHLVK